MTPEEYKSQVNEIVDAHIEKTRAFDTRKDYHKITKATTLAIQQATDAFCEAQVVEVTETREVLFVREYGQPSELVREQYIKLLEDNSVDSYEIGLQVWVKGYNRRKTRHLGLKPEAYRVCKPDERILSAFAVINERCEIDEKCLCAAHSNVW